MTVNQKAMRKVISGVGWSNPLTHNVYLENVAHLKVYSDGVLLVGGVDYSVDKLQQESGYEVTIASFAPGAEPDWYFPTVWVLSVEPPIDQPADISLGGNFGAPFEDAIDRLARRMQHVYDMALRSIKSPLTTDPATLDQDDLIMVPEFIIDFNTKYELILSTAVQVGQDADAAQEAAEDAESARDAAEAARDTTAGYMSTIQNWYDSVNVWQAQVTVDKAAVVALAAAVEGYRDEVEADRIEVQGDKVIASAAADTAVLAAGAAEAARNIVLSTYDQFDDRYLGTKSANPAVDNDGNALVPGALYFFDGNGTPANAEMRIWRGDIWVAAYASGTGFLVASQNLNDLTNPATARTNLDVYSTAEIDAMPGSFASKTTPVDADSWSIWDSIAGAAKRITGANLKVYLKAYFDALYASASQGGKADTAVQPTAIRERLTATRTYYVRTDGSDSNDGLANTSGAAFLTIQKAVDVALATLDFNGFNVVIKVANGTYTSPVLVLFPKVGAGRLIISGNTASPGSVILSRTGGDAVYCEGFGTQIYIEGCRIQTSGGGVGMVAANGGEILINGNMNFGACAVFHMFAFVSGIIRWKAGSVTIAGGSFSFAIANFNGQIAMENAPITLTGTPAFSSGFVNTAYTSSLNFKGATFSGAATGQRYRADYSATIFTDGGGANFFPGNSAGTDNSGRGHYA